MEQLWISAANKGMIPKETISLALFASVIEFVAWYNANSLAIFWTCNTSTSDARGNSLNFEVGHTDAEFGNMGMTQLGGLSI